ncbi:MAG: hypothetical protein AAFZ87_03900, partial [Planctomycetota bacterium]
MLRLAAPLVALTAALGGSAYAWFAMERGDGLLGMGRSAAGVILGVVIGAGVGLLAHSLVRAALRVDTQAAFQALVVGFGAKAAGAVLPWGALSFVPRAAELADPTSYVIAYAFTVLVVVGAGVLDNLHLSNEIALDAMEAGRAPGSADQGSRSGDPLQPQGSSDALE